MDFILESGFDIQVGREEAFQRWLKDNEARLAASYPQGVEYIGWYVAVFTSEKTGGSYRIFERFENYAALDRLAAAEHDAASEFARVWHEAVSFMDPDPRGNWSRSLLKSVVAATIWDIKPNELGQPDREPVAV